MKISVVIPCHNGEPYLAQAIRSALEQSRPPHEVIVVDDSSTDASAAVARTFGDAVRVESKAFKNAALTRNHGASLATGDAIMFLDADDVLGPDVLEALSAELKEHPHSIAACPWYRLELKGSRWIRQPPSCAPRGPDQDPLDAWLRGWYHPPCSVLWSRAALEVAGDWDDRADPNDDGELMMRALVRGVPLRLVQDGAAFYRRLPEGSMSLSGTRFTKAGLRSRLYVITKIARMLEERGRLDAHRPAIGHALSRILWDCGSDHPDVAEECRTRRRRYGEAAWRRIGRNLVRRVGAAVVGSSREDVGDGPGAAEGEPEEVRYGLEEQS